MGICSDRIGFLQQFQRQKCLSERRNEKIMRKVLKWCITYQNKPLQHFAKVTKTTTAKVV